MHVLHLGYRADGCFYLWAEDSESRTGGDPATSGEPSKVREHPFAADVWTLWDFFEETAPGWMLRRGSDRTAVLLLPSSEHEPQASPRLLRDRLVEDRTRFDHVRPWHLPVLTLPGDAALHWLREEWPRLRGVAFGDEWPVWRRLADLATRLADSGQLVPMLETHASEPVARWHPIPGRQAVLEELRQLEEAMPHSVRADVTDVLAPDDGPEDWSSLRPPSIRDVLAQGLQSMSDGLARSRLRDRCSPSIPGRSAAEAWLGALADDDPVVDATEEELARLQRALDDWTRELRRREQQRVRLQFRLEPPPVPEATELDVELVDEPWKVVFSLQSIEEPSLQVDAETIWSSTDEADELLEDRLDHPRERLLEELGRARELYPALERALETREPTHLELETHEAFDFLDAHAAGLDRAGFEVRVPNWWDASEHRLGARLQTDDTEGDELGLDALLAFDWEVALGDETLERHELEQLAELKKPLVRHRGEWVVLDEDDIEAALEMLDEGGGEIPADEALRTTLGLEETELPVVDAEFDGWIGELFDDATDTGVDPRPTPDSFRGELRPYQTRGLGWIRYLERLGLGGCLADDMGLGKTIQVLARLAEERDERETPPGPTLAVVPLSVLGNWRREAERFVPDLEVRVHHDSDRLAGEAMVDALSDADLVLTTYGVVRSDIDDLVRLEWHRVVLDEAQKVKNSSAGRTRAVRRLQAERRLALTGTPVENRLTELWSIMQFLNPGMLGSEEQFRDEIARPVEAGDGARTEMLRQWTTPFVLRRLKTDERIIDDLPEKTEIKEYCSLTSEQVTLYQSAVDEAMEHLEDSEGMERRGTVLKLMNHLKQICNHPAHFLDEDDSRLEGRSGKLARLEALADDIVEAGDKALLFTQYTTMGRHLCDYLQHRLGRRVLYLHGQTPRDTRDRMVEQFQDPEGPPFFLLSLRAGGTGLTLTAANHVIHYDRWWNPAVEDQATDRAFRIGQTDDVQVRKLVCEGTFEERIDAMIERKKELAERVLSEGEAFLTELSLDELRDVVTLSKEALS